jgi:TRAP-type C4-dicarboxylate transport system substrate-binding protein
MGFRITTAILAALVAAGAVTLDAQRAPRIATIAPENSIYWKSLREMTEAWKQRTSGRVNYLVTAGGDVTEKSMLLNMQPTFKKLQGAQLSAITLGEVETAFNVFGLPMFYESYAEADRVLERLAPELDKRLAGNGYKALSFAYAGWVHVFSKKPVTTVDDLRKLPLFTSSGDDRWPRWYNANGFRPVPLDPTAMLSSLHMDMIQAVPAPPVFAHLLTWYKSAPYMMDLGFAPLVGSTVLSLEAWNRISPEDQAIVLEESRKAGQALRREVPRLEQEAIEAMKKNGLTVTTADKAEWRRVAAQLAEAMRRDGLVPADIYDAAKAARGGR